MSTISVPDNRQDEMATESGSSGMRSDRSRWLGILATVGSILGGTLLIAIHASFYGNWIMDDAAITFGYARNVAEGNGPVLVPGADPVEGFSNPLWMLLLALGKLLGLFDHGTIFGIPDYVLFPKALALACCAGMLTLFYFAAKPLTKHPRLVTLITGAVIAAIPSFVIWAFSGLENSLYALAVVALAVLIQRAVLDGRLRTPKVALIAGVLVTCAALTRPDGLIYAGAYPLVVLATVNKPNFGASVRSVLWSLLSFGVLFGGYMVFRWFEFHRLVANPVVAKAQKFPELEDLAKTGLLIDYVGWIGVVLVAGCLTVVMLKPSRLRAGLMPLLVTFGLAVAAYTIIAPDWMGQHRFASPVWVLGAFISTVVVVSTFSAARIRGRIVVAVLVVAAGVLSTMQLVEQGEGYRDAVKTPLCIVAERDGRTLNGLADILAVARPSAAVVDLGGQAMTSRLDLTDLGGLGTARTAEFVGADDWLGLRDYIFNEVKPTFINTIGGWDRTIGFPDDPRFDREYALVFRGPPPYDGMLFSYNHVNIWVRRDQLPNEAKLREMQTYADQRVLPILSLNATAPRRSCGPVLARGQTS
jgi:hypothetical protein